MIQRSVRVLLAILPVLVTPCTEAATIILNDGGVHTISGPSDPVAVSNGTTLNIQNGTVISGGTPSVSIGLTSRLTVAGGSITGGSIPGNPGEIDGGGRNFLCWFCNNQWRELPGGSGGNFQGGVAAGLARGGAGATISGPATISGGTFQGGIGPLLFRRTHRLASA